MDDNKLPKITLCHCCSSKGFVLTDNAQKYLDEVNCEHVNFGNIFMCDC